VPPSTPTSAAGSFVSAAPAIAAADAPPPNWWRLYNDPVLDRLVTQALAANKDIEVAAANLMQARALLSEARAGRYPTTDLSGGATYGRSGATGSTPPSNIGVVYDAGFAASYEVDLFGRIRRTIESARANVDVAQAAEDVLRVSIAAQTAQAYADVCAYAEQDQVAHQSLEVVTGTYNLTVTQRSAGAASDFDVARAGALVQQTRATIPTVEGQRRAALFELAVLTGRPPAEIPTDAAQCRVPPRLTTPLPVGDGTALLRRRPDVRQAERRLASDVAQIGVATAALYPTVTLGGSVSSAGPAGEFGTARSVSFGIGPLISWSFPNQAVARARIEEARAGASGALASFDSTVLQALNDAEQTLTAYGAELDRHAALVAARDQNAEAYRLAQVRYQAGSSSFLDLLTTESSLVAAETALASSDEALSTDQIAVFRALGGGWQEAPAVTPPAIPDGKKAKTASAAS
jgi:NodT family efflux transporter outer membrane factor (OMF) lipoprotein